MTGANSVASFQKRHSRRSFDNCGSAPTSRDLSNRKVPQEWRGDHACIAASGITGGAISFAICLHGDLSTRGPIWVSALPWMEELSMELSFTGLAKKGQNGLSWKMVRARGSSSWESGGTVAEASAPAVARSAAAYSEAERQQRRPKAAPVSAPALLLNFRQRLPVTSQRQLHHSMAPPPQHPRRHVQGIFLP